MNRGNAAIKRIHMNIFSGTFLLPFFATRFKWYFISTIKAYKADNNNN